MQQRNNKSRNLNYFVKFRFGNTLKDDSKKERPYNYDNETLKAILDYKPPKQEKWQQVMS